MPSQPVNVKEGTELNVSLGFVANSVTIYNLTQSWAYEKQSQTFIPPYQYGVVIPIPGTDTGDIQWRTPTSLSAGPVGTGTLTATYTSDALAPSNGVSVFTQQTSVVIATVNNGITSGPLSLPGGTQALMLVAQGVATLGYRILGLTTAAFYGTATGVPSGQIVPVSATADPQVTVTNLGTGVPIVVIALFTSEPEPIQSVSITGTVTDNLTQIGGTPVSNVVPGTLDVNLKDVGGSPSGVLNVNIADLNGSASVVGQELMAASFPVVIASNQSALSVNANDNLSQVGGAGVTLGSKVSASSIPVVVASDDTLADNLTQIKGTAIITPTISTAALNGVLSVAGAFQPRGAANESYLSVKERPSIQLVSGLFTLVAGTGQTLIAAPGVGFSIVLRKAYFSVSAAPAATCLLSLGTVSSGATLYRLAIILAAAATPLLQSETMPWDDYLVGDNLPVIITASQGMSTEAVVTYSIVTTALWPTN
jgi:hypothetical protein